MAKYYEINGSRFDTKKEALMWLLKELNRHLDDDEVLYPDDGYGIFIGKYAYDVNKKEDA